MFSGTHRGWDKTRPFVLAIGLHALVLGLLCVSFLRQSQPAPGQTGVSLVEATLVSAPLQTEIEQAESPPQPPAQPQQPPPQPEPPSVTPQAPSLKQPEVGPDAQRPAAEPVAEQHQPQVPDAEPKQVAVEPPSQPKQASENSPSLAQQQPDASDPYAEMRRQRAEAEHQHQLEEQALTQSEEARARYAQANVQRAPVAPARQMAGNGGVSPDPDRTANPFAVDSATSADDVLRPQRCRPIAARQQGNDAVMTGWIDCLLDAAVPDPANAALRTVGLPYGGFD